LRWLASKQWLGSGIEDKRHLYCGDRGAPTPDGVPGRDDVARKSSQNELVYASSPGIGKIMFAARSRWMQSALVAPSRPKTAISEPRVVIIATAVKDVSAINLP